MQVSERLLVVVAVAEEVAVLVRALVLGPRLRPAVGGAQGGVGVVEQRPASPVEDAGVQLNVVDVGAGLVRVSVEAAGPAAELPRLVSGRRSRRARARVGGARGGQRDA